MIHPIYYPYLCVIILIIEIIYVKINFDTHNNMTELFDYELSPEHSNIYNVHDSNWLPAEYYMILHMLDVCPSMKYPSKDLFYFIAFMATYTHAILESHENSGEFDDKIMSSIYSIIHSNSNFIDMLNKENPQFTWGEEADETRQSIPVLITHMNRIALLHDLLVKGMNSDLRNEQSKTTALQVAVQHENVKFIRELIEYNACLDSQDYTGKSANDYAESSTLLYYHIQVSVEMKQLNKLLEELREKNTYLENRILEIEKQHIHHLEKLHKILGEGIQIMSSEENTI